MKTTTFGIAALLALFLSGCNSVNVCYDHEYGICILVTVHTPEMQVVQLPDASNDCACPAAKRFKIVNGARREKVSILELAREPADTAPAPQTSSPILEPGQSMTLACTVQPTAVSKLCQRSVVSIVNGKAYGGDVNSLMQGIVVSSAKADMQTMTALPAAKGDCPQKCKSSTDCPIRIDATKSGSVELGRSIALLFNKQTAIIPNEKIVGLIGSKTNECLRSDIVFEGNRAFNVGLLPECQIQVTSQSSFGKMEIEVPRTLAFKHGLGQGGNFSLRFEHRQAAPKLSFSNAVYQSRLGGNVLAVDYDSGNFVFETEANACFAVRVN